ALASRTRRLFRFFLLRLPPPPSSTLFPYTTLFRSGGPGCGEAPCEPHLSCHPISPRAPEPRESGALPRFRGRPVLSFPHEGRRRSEEHTSELQSRENLVCRLLLEKKKKKANTKTHT